MNKYNGIDYEANIDCFKKTKDVKSIFLYGDKKYIKDPFLTVLIPTYKREYLLNQALKSVLTQWHTDFSWDILVLDNEPYDGKDNRTYKLIKKINNKRILYYRNTQNIRPGDNFNRGILLSRGKWVMMLHDDDLLIANAVMRMGKLIKAYEKIGDKPLGNIVARRIQFSYNEKYDRINDIDIRLFNNYYTNLPVNYNLYKLTHKIIWFTSHIGGDVPSNGTTYNKEAVIKTGGFNEDYGISGDLILSYSMENNYSVYSTTMPFGFYRWGNNSMMKIESTHRTIKDGFDFREYVYSKGFFSKICGLIFRKYHYFKFTSDVVNERNRASKEKISLEDFDYIYDKRPSKIMYFIYTNIIIRGYNFYKKIETKILSKKARRVMENE